MGYSALNTVIIWTCCCLFRSFPSYFHTELFSHDCVVFILLLVWISRSCTEKRYVVLYRMRPPFFEGLVVLVKGHLFSFHCPSPVCKYAQQTDRAYVEVKPTNTRSVTRKTSKRLIILLLIKKAVITLILTKNFKVIYTTIKRFGVRSFKEINT